MKSFAFVLVSLFTIVATAQQPRTTWGEEFRMARGSTDLDVIYADKTGVYLQESHNTLKGYFVIAATTRGSATLVKLDKNLSEQYRNDFNKELKGKEFEQFFVLQNKLYILASDYNNKEKTMDLLVSAIDNTSGELQGDWRPLASLQKEDKRDAIQFKLSYNEDSTRMILVSTIAGKERNNYQVQQFDRTLKALGRATSIFNEFEPKTFQLEDVIYTNTNRIVLVGRVYAYEEGKKKKAKFLDFSNYNIRIYDEKGKMQTNLNTTINGKWMVSTKVVQQPGNDLVLASFYSNDKKGKEVDGLLVQRIDPTSGQVLNTSEKAINTSLISTVEEATNDDNDEESKQERKEREKLEKLKNENDGFSRYMKFSNILYTADKGLVILAEKYHHYTYTTTTMTGQNQWQTTTYSVFECGDLMMCKIDAAGAISWLNVLPKQQKEVIRGGSSVGFSIGTNYFQTYNMPFYAGFGVLQTPTAMNLIFNDNPKNEGVVQLGQKVKQVNYFRKSTCFAVTLDPITGKYTRKHLFANNEVPTAMPRLSTVIGTDMYLIGKEDRLLGKTKVAVAKISVPKL